MHLATQPVETPSRCPHGEADLCLPAPGLSAVRRGDGTQGAGKVIRVGSSASAPFHFLEHLLQEQNHRTFRSQRQRADELAQSDMVRE